jgi:hypothetical protein
LDVSHALAVLVFAAVLRAEFVFNCAHRVCRARGQGKVSASYSGVIKGSRFTIVDFARGVSVVADWSALTARAQVVDVSLSPGSVGDSSEAVLREVVRRLAARLFSMLTVLEALPSTYKVSVVHRPRQPHSMHNWKQDS